MDAAGIIRTARRAARLSQRELAARAGTSGPTVAAYESGRVEPRLSTLERLVEAAGRRLVVQAVPRTEPTREERRSLFLHVAVADHLRRRPAEVLERARRNLRTMRAADVTGRAERWLDAWDRLLSADDAELVARVLTDPDDPEARELRQNSPFAGVLTPRERWDLLRRFRSAAG